MHRHKACLPIPVVQTICHFRTLGALCALALIAALLGSAAQPASAGAATTTAKRLENIDPGAGTDPLIAVGDSAFAVAQVEVSAALETCRHELWRSDGTEAGTVMVKGISTTTDCSDGPGWFTAVAETLFFVTDDGSHGSELWKSDGTEAGTVLVADIAPGQGVGANPGLLTDVGGTLFFAADDGIHGRELWRSDGTEAGTVMVKDIEPDGSSSPGSLTAVDGTLFFLVEDPLHPAHDGNSGSQLWKSDGTEAGTVMVKDIDPEPGTAFASGLTDVGGRLFFGADDGIHGRELWRSDGTEDGTVMVKDIDPGSQSSDTAGLSSRNDTLLFRADDGIHGSELWRSDGTESGTVMVKDINPNAPDSVPFSLTAVDATVFFSADDGSRGRELWRSDGTEDGTTMVKDIDPNSSGFRLSSADELADVAGTLFFRADDGTHGSRLWKSDGTEEGTTMITDIRPGSGPSGPRHLTAVNDNLFFFAEGALWATAPLSPPEPCPDDPAALCAPAGDSDFEANERTIRVDDGDGDVGIRGNANLISVGSGFAGTVTVSGDDNVLRASHRHDDIAVYGCGNEIAGGGGADDLVVDCDATGWTPPTNIVEGGTGDDVLVNEGRPATLRGGPDSDVVVGGTGRDRLFGGGGEDRLFGGRGHDRIVGGWGDDRLIGARGNDRLRGGPGHDRIYGRSGHDRLFGGRGNDFLDGGKGRDACRGGPGRDRLRRC